jgi:hypothetical protein
MEVEIVAPSPTVDSLVAEVVRHFENNRAVLATSGRVLEGGSLA